jgi:hypothetical protein
MKWRILKSPANELVLMHLGLRYEVTPAGIIFEGDPENDLEKIALALRWLSLAHNWDEAYRIAASFFLNPVS